MSRWPAYLVVLLGLAGAVYRLSPASALDPQLGAYVTYPPGLGLRISASYLRDPLALWGVLGYSRAFGDRPGAASLSLTAALVANAVFTLYAGVSYQAPVGGVAVPTASLSLGAGYTFNLDSKLYIGGKSVTTGGGAGLGLQLGLSGSSPGTP